MTFQGLRLHMQPKQQNCKLSVLHTTLEMSSWSWLALSSQHSDSSTVKLELATTTKSQESRGLTGLCGYAHQRALPLAFSPWRTT